MARLLDQIGEMSAGATEVVAIDYSDWLDAGELLASVDSVAEVTTSVFTISNEAVSTAQLTILGETVAIGQAAQFKIVAASSTCGNYKVRITVTTDATPARTDVSDYIVRVVD